MNQVQARLKSEGFGTVFEIMAKVYKKVLVGYLVQTIISLVILVPLMISVLGIDIMDYVSILQMSDPLRQQEYMQAMIQDMAMNLDASAGGYLMVSMIILFLVFAWFYNFSLICVEAYIRNRRISLGSIFSASFNGNVLWIFLATIILTIIFMVLASIAGMLSASIGGVGFLLFLMLAVFGGALLMRFIITYPAIVHGNLSVGAAMSYSWSTITMGRGFKYLAIAFLVMICLVVLGAMVGVAQAAIMSIPVIGMALYVIVTILYGAGVSSWLVAVLSGIYYRHLELQEGESDLNIEDHLII